jgi:hypothetical protein
LNFDPSSAYGPTLWRDGNSDGDGDGNLSDYNALNVAVTAPSGVRRRLSGARRFFAVKMNPSGGLPYAAGGLKSGDAYL